MKIGQTITQDDYCATKQQAKSMRQPKPHEAAYATLRQLHGVQKQNILTLIGIFWGGNF